MYNNKVILRKREVITPITDSMITLYYKKKAPIINFTTGDMTSKFELLKTNYIQLKSCEHIGYKCLGE